MFADRRGLLSAVPARDVLHIRLPDPRNPLVGVPPLEAALLEVQASDAMVKQALAYTANQGRPSGVEPLFPNKDRDRLALPWNAFPCTRR